jgi:hypothetical protein
VFKRLRQYLDDHVSLKNVDAAATIAVTLGTVAAYETFALLWGHFRTYKDVEKYDSGHNVVIICPDDGKLVAFRGRCPKCGGASWVPAGHAGGIDERRRVKMGRDQEITEASKAT